MGIDPGKSGGIAVISLDGSRYAAESMIKKTVKDRFDLLRFHSEFVKYTFIEKVHGMPNDGPNRAFKFGRNYGEWHGLLTSLGYAYEEVLPVTWQRNLKCLTGGDKRISKNKAEQMFPGVRVTHATADALLIAEYGRRVFSSRYLLR